MREMKDSGVEWIGKIPASWNSHPLYYYFDERKNRNFDLRERNLLSLSYGNIIKKDINTTGGLLPASFNTYNIVKNLDIIIRPTDLQNDKKSLRTGLVKEKIGIITSAYIALKPREGVFSNYFHYLLHSYDIMKVFYNMGNGVRQGLNYSEFSKLILVAPSLDEQHKIVDFLDKKCAEIDALIADIQTQIKTLEEYKKSVITEAVTKGLAPNVQMKDSGVEWIGKIPANWTVIKIKYLSNEVNQKKLMNTESMYSYLGLENLKSYSDEIIKTETDYDEGIQKFCHKGNVLFSKLRPYLAKVMICPYDTFATSEFLELSPSECVCDANYLKYSMLNSSFINEVNLSTYGAKMPRADASYIKNIKICITNLDEQHRIADFLDQKCAEIDQTISEKQLQLETLAEYKKSLIYEYVTGKKEVA